MSRALQPSELGRRLSTAVPSDLGRRLSTAVPTDLGRRLSTAVPTNLGRRLSTAVQPSNIGRRLSIFSQAVRRRSSVFSAFGKPASADEPAPSEPTDPARVVRKALSEPTVNFGGFTLSGSTEESVSFHKRVKRRMSVAPMERVVDDDNEDDDEVPP
jgi:hypothetical protein